MAVSDTPFVDMRILRWGAEKPFEDFDVIHADFARQLEREIAKAQAELAAVTAERDALQRFKEYVHQRLDDAGVPVDPDSPHKAAGCRIGGRMDVIIGERDTFRAELASVREERDVLRPDFDRAWDKFLSDDRLMGIRNKLSMHDIRQIFYVAVEGLLGPPQDAAIDSAREQQTDWRGE